MEKKEKAYIRIYKKLREEIVQGAFSYGMRFPSRRTMAEKEGVSTVTVDHAYELLCEEGYIEARQRSGYFVIYREGDLFDAPEYVPEGEEYSGQKESEQFPYTVFAKAVRTVLSKYGEQILLPSEGTGCLVLRRALAAYLQRSRGISVDPEQIVVGSGSEYLYSLIVQIAGRDRIYGIEDPGYARIKEIYAANGVQVDLLPLGRNGIRSDALKKTKAGVLHVTPYHSWPTMNTADASKRMEYIRWAARRDAYIVEDDYESEFTVSRKAEQTLFSLEPDNHIIYMNTFSRTIASSVRLSYMILPGRKTGEILEMIGFRSCTVSSLLQYTIAELLNNGSFERHMNRIRRMRRKGEQK